MAAMTDEDQVLWYLTECETFLHLFNKNGFQGEIGMAPGLGSGVRAGNFELINFTMVITYFNACISLGKFEKPPMKS